MKKIFLFFLIALIASGSYAQQHFTLTCTNLTRNCNNACTAIYNPQLDSGAILLATPSTALATPFGTSVSNSHVLGICWIQVNGKWLWSVNYQDAQTMNLGTTFDVQYFAQPDPNYQFVHHVNQPGASRTTYTSYIDHVNLNGNPNAVFHYIANGNGTHMYPVTFKYDAAEGKWYLTNNNNQPFAFDAAYNIVIESIPLGKSNIIVDPNNPKIITNPTTALNSNAQQQFTHTASKENNYCNYACTLMDVPELNGNPDAIIFVKSIEVNGINLNPHPIIVYYIQKKWSIDNIDNAAMQPGIQFEVQYYAKPDTNHFVHVVTKENLVKKGSYIDHAGLNDHPDAQFQFFQNWAPSIRGGLYNRYDIKIQYDTTAGKWYMFNTNGRQLDYATAYNIAISSGGNANTIPVIGNSGIVNKVEPKLVPGKTVPTSYDFSHIRICIDKVNNNPLPPRPPVTTPVLPKIKPNGELEPVSTVTQGLTIVTDKMWSPGDVINVGLFPGGGASSFVLNKVKQFAKEWETYANIKFQFVDPFSIISGAQTQIKVGFVKDNTSWSLVGRDVLNNTTGGMTVNFGWFDDNTADAEFRRTVVHEFGHVLGFIHEHQSPLAGIPWDIAKVYAYFEGDPNFWSKEMIDHNIFYVYSKTGTNYSAYDKLSIMHYWFPPELTKDGSAFSWNTDLSEIDKQYAKIFYPFPYVNTSGVLQTGDDCDEIVFSVEYNVVDKNGIQFILEHGTDLNNNPVTWWKKIGIPLIGGSEAVLEIQDGSSTNKTIPVSLIDKTRGISFGKAKFIGGHTTLNYKWNVLPGIIGGCRIKLTWRRDKC